MNINTNIVSAVIISALISLSAGYALGQSTNDAPQIAKSLEEDHDHNDDAADADEMHAHDMFEVAAENAPEIIDFRVGKDTKTGWNVHFDVESFEFAPQNASTDHVDGEGHAHVYVDGQKINRMYSGDYYLGELSEGEHTVRVTLNTNDHQEYTVEGRAVEARQTIIDMHHVGDGESESHSH